MVVTTASIAMSWLSVVRRASGVERSMPEVLAGLGLESEPISSSTEEVSLELPCTLLDFEANDEDEEDVLRRRQKFG